MEPENLTKSDPSTTANPEAVAVPVTPAPAPIAETVAVAASAPPVKKSSPYFKIIIIFLVLGVLIGGPLAYYFFFYREVKSPVTGEQIEMPLGAGAALVSPTAAAAKPLTLTLTTPADGELTTGSQITVTGTTLPATAVMVFTDNNETSAESDAGGNFSAVINLTEGINALTVTAFGENGEEKSLTVDVVWDI